MMNSFFMAISTLSPKSVRKIFEREDFDQVFVVEEQVTVEKQMLKKESSDDFSDMTKRYYKSSYIDLEKAEHLTVKDDK